MYAPIVLFVYNRPFHTRRSLKSLARNYLSKESELYIFSDGPKKDSSKEQVEKIKETRKILRERKWCGNVTIVERKENMGLANSVIAGVTEIVNRFGKVIVVEDDLLLSRNFLKYMNSALDRFEKEERVMQISGYMFPVELFTKNDALFLPFTTSWGWATWKRNWSLFDKDMRGLDILKNNSERRRNFDLNNSYPYFHRLIKQKSGKDDSWAICFYLSVFLNDGMVLYPKKTLVWNGGFDGSGIHSKVGFYQGEVDDLFEVQKFPKNTIINDTVKNKIYAFIKKQNNIFAIVSRIILGKIKST